MNLCKWNVSRALRKIFPTNIRDKATLNTTNSFCSSVAFEAEQMLFIALKKIVFVAKKERKVLCGTTKICCVLL